MFGLHQTPGRFELIDEGQDFSVVVDYAHSPDSFSRLLDAGRELGAKRIITGNFIFIFFITLDSNAHISIQIFSSIWMCGRN